MTGEVACKGQTINVSDCGIFALVDLAEVPEVDTKFLLEVDLPSTISENGSRQRQTAHYVARLVRTEQIDELIGLGMELTERIS